MPAPQPPVPSRPPLPAVCPGVSMRDLLASCAAAEAVSRPPGVPEPERSRPAADQCEAA